MRNNKMRFLIKFICTALAIVLVVSNIPVQAHAEEDPFIVVSMGDSYSSGESIEKFYGQDKKPEKKVQDNDWLAHRSKASWPGRLTFSDLPDNKTLKDYKVADGQTSTNDYQWYFVASSGATTYHFDHKQPKPYDQNTDGFWDLKAEGDDAPKLDPQLDVFDRIPANTVDYVTFTIGGNDVGFSDVVSDAFIYCSHLHFGKTSALEDDFIKVWNNIDSYIENFVKAYVKVERAAGVQAEIIVAGYPQLLDPNGRGAAFNKTEAQIVNENVTAFNDLIQDIVTTLAGESTVGTRTEHHDMIVEIISLYERPDAPMSIHFVDVEEAFRGHQAYSVDENGDNDEWINGVILPAKNEDLDHDGIKSAYSMHPNWYGAKAYADCVNAKIREIEDSKKTGTLSGKIVKASDRTTPVTTASVTVTSGNRSWVFQPDANGTYSRTLPVGTYRIQVLADGYIDFNAYVQIEENQTIYMETFLMVEGEEGQEGEAGGTITNALTGIGLEGVRLDVRSGWNNDGTGEILTTVTTNSAGSYVVNLPIGNYTLTASKDGFVSTIINIVVQPNMCTYKNASMTPIISGDNYRIVLTWGENPRDLDSHVVGTLSDGESFHVYYSHKSQYDGDVEVCNLDYDDTTSYGPETITLNPTGSSPYYYYIYRFAGSGTVASSGAQVKVYQGENVIATFNVPTDLGSGDYWNVFAIVNGRLVVRNTITSSAETSYAGAGGANGIQSVSVSEHPVYDDAYPAKEE